MPNIPGSDFAASIIQCATAVSSVLLATYRFTNSVTSRTNPIRFPDQAPVPAASEVAVAAVLVPGLRLCWLRCACAGGGR
jgi:hypothetical protein